jgi:hypothetical protein
LVAAEQAGAVVVDTAVVDVVVVDDEAAVVEVHERSEPLRVVESFEAKDVGSGLSEGLCSWNSRGILCDTLCDS